MKLVLHNYWRSSASYRVRIGLALKQLDYDYVAVNVVAGDQHGADYRAKNPLGQVPTLEIIEDDGARCWLTQSLAILEYLDERWPEPAILPRDPLGRARARQLAEIINSGIQPLQNTGTLRRVKELGGDQIAWMQPFIADGLLAFARCAAAAGTGPFCVGDSPTIADICLVPQLAAAERFAVPLDPMCDRLREIGARCLALPAFARAVPDHQPDAPGGTAAPGKGVS